MLVFCLANRKKVQQQPAERGISPPAVAELENKSILPQRLYTGTTSPIKWPNRAITVAGLTCACKRIKCKTVEVHWDILDGFKRYA